MCVFKKSGSRTHNVKKKYNRDKILFFNCVVCGYYYFIQSNCEALLKQWNIHSIFSSVKDNSRHWLCLVHALDVRNSGFIKGKLNFCNIERGKRYLLRAKNENTIWEKCLITSRLCIQVTRNTRAIFQVLITKNDLFRKNVALHAAKLSAFDIRNNKLEF